MGNSDWKNTNFGIVGNGVRHRLIKRIMSPYRTYKKFLDQSQWWSEQHLLDYQLEHLKATIESAYRNVPYYRGKMQVYGVKPEDIKSIDFIVKLPIVEKEDVRQNYDDMLAMNAFPSFLYKCHTSGSTGKPLTLYRDLNNVGFEHAILMRQWQWARLEPNDPYATLKGEMIPKIKTRNNIFWSYSPMEKKLYMSSYHLSERNVDRYVTALRKHHIKAVEGYPSSLYALAKLMLNKNIRVPLKSALTTSETLVPRQKAVIEQAFQCQVYDYYGMAERVAAIHTCEYGRYHLVPEYSLVEFIRSDSLNKGLYEIVGTTFTNRAMPLIRYKVGDVIKPSQDQCPCGRNYPVIEKIVGRTDDYIITPSGKLVGRLDHVFKGAKNLIEAQIFQPDIKNVILRIVPDQFFKQGDADSILYKLQKRLGEPMHLEIEQLSFIPRTENGKLKTVISNVPGILN